MRRLLPALALASVAACSAKAPPVVREPAPPVRPRLERPQGPAAPPVGPAAAPDPRIEHALALVLLGAVASFRCTFGEWSGYSFETRERTTKADASTFTFDAVDTAAGRARVIGDAVAADARVFANGAGLHFVEEAPAGNVFLTSIFAVGERPHGGKARFAATRSTHFLLPPGRGASPGPFARGPFASVLVGWCEALAVKP